MSDARPGGPRLVSTGSLPDAARVAELVEQAVDHFGGVDEGAVSGVYPALAAADPRHLGVCVVGVTGNVHRAGDADVAFPLMSVAKPFTLALVCERIGQAEVRDRIGVNATGLPFDSTEAVERNHGRTNPMVNPGAIATVGLLGDDRSEVWPRLAAGLSAFAGRELALDEATFASASATNFRNRSLALLLESFDAVDGDPLAVLDLYTRQSCLAVTAADLAAMGATLAHGGVNPLTRERVVSEDSCHAALAVMATAGLYEGSGEWLYRVGLPGKSGIGGGIVTVSPGKGGLGTYLPLLDEAGNSVRGQLVAEFLSDRLGLDIFASAPEDA